MPEEIIKETMENKPEKPLKKMRSFMNKVIIRKLPTSLTADKLLEILSPFPDIIDFYFCPADWSLGGEATSRAYIEFKREEDIFIFKEKFDGYIFVDARGAEFRAIVEYASFQGLPKSRARKKDKNVSTIEDCDHFLGFLEQIKKEEDEGTSTKNEVTYSYQLKDDKKITSTPLIEFLAAKNQEKRDVKRKKQEEKRKQRDEEKHKKKIQVTKSIPEPIKESKEEVVYADGVVVRTIPSRLGRRKETKSEVKIEKEPSERDQKRSETRSRRKKEKDEKRKIERDQQKTFDRDQTTNSKADLFEGEKQKELKEQKEIEDKKETKRYSVLRKARQEKSNEFKEPDEFAAPKVDEKNKALVDPAKKETKSKRSQELKEKRVREAERAQRQIKNKDRPTMQIYQPKRRSDTENKGESLKSSDEFSESNRRNRSETDQKSEKREKRNEKRVSKKSSRDETEKRKTLNEELQEASFKSDVVVEKLEKITLETQENF